MMMSAEMFYADNKIVEVRYELTDYKLGHSEMEEATLWKIDRDRREITVAEPIWHWLRAAVEAEQDKERLTEELHELHAVDPIQAHFQPELDRIEEKYRKTIDRIDVLFPPRLPLAAWDCMCINDVRAATGLPEI